MDLIALAGSSRIRAYGWEAQAAAPATALARLGRLGVLQIEFTDGARWYYFDVPAAVYEGFITSRSKGSFFAQHIQRSFRAQSADEVERQQSGG